MGRPMTASLSRRQFMEKGTAAAAVFSAASLGMLAAGCGRHDDVRTSDTPRATPDGDGDPGAWRGIVLQPNEGELLISGGRRAPVRIKVDSTIAIGATMSMIVSQVDPGASIPVHLHRNEDELIFIHSGEGIVTLGDVRVPVTAGAVLYGARNVWHGVENTGSTAIIWCAVYSPPGFEQFFREVGVVPGNESAAPSADRVREIARTYGMIFRS